MIKLWSNYKVLYNLKCLLIQISLLQDYYISSAQNIVTYILVLIALKKHYQFKLYLNLIEGYSHITID